MNYGELRALLTTIVGIKAFLQPLEKITEEDDSFQADVAETLYTINKFKEIVDQTEKIDKDLVTANDINELIRFLDLRWDRISNTKMAYTQNSHNCANQLCLALAELLNKNDDTYKSHFQYLMPTLKTLKDIISSTDLCDSAVEVTDFVPTDDKTYFIDVCDVLHHAMNNNAQLLKYNPENKCCEQLSENEIKCVINHSEASKHFYDAIIHYYQFTLSRESVGSCLKYLIERLELGSYKHNGTEDNAGTEANQAIVKFALFYEQLPHSAKTTLNKSFTKESDIDSHEIIYTFEDIWYILSSQQLEEAAEINNNPELNDAQKETKLKSLHNDSDAPTCIYINANILKKILNNNPKLYDIKLSGKLAISQDNKSTNMILKKEMLRQQNKLIHFMTNKPVILYNPYGNKGDIKLKNEITSPFILDDKVFIKLIAKHTNCFYDLCHVNEQAAHYLYNIIEGNLHQLSAEEQQPFLLFCLGLAKFVFSHNKLWHLTITFPKLLRDNNCHLFWKCLTYTKNDNQFLAWIQKNKPTWFTYFTDIYAHIFKRKENILWLANLSNYLSDDEYTSLLLICTRRAGYEQMKNICIANRHTLLSMSPWQTIKKLFLKFNPEVQKNLIIQLLNDMSPSQCQQPAMKTEIFVTAARYYVPVNQRPLSGYDRLYFRHIHSEHLPRPINHFMLARRIYASYQLISAILKKLPASEASEIFRQLSIEQQIIALLSPHIPRRFLTPFWININTNQKKNSVNKVITNHLDHIKDNLTKIPDCLSRLVLFYASLIPDKQTATIHSTLSKDNLLKHFILSYCSLHLISDQLIAFMLSGSQPINRVLNSTNGHAKLRLAKFFRHNRHWLFENKLISTPGYNSELLSLILDLIYDPNDLSLTNKIFLYLEFPVSSNYDNTPMTFSKGLDIRLLICPIIFILRNNKTELTSCTDTINNLLTSLSTNDPEWVNMLSDLQQELIDHSTKSISNKVLTKAAKIYLRYSTKPRGYFDATIFLHCLTNDPNWTRSYVSKLKNDAILPELMQAYIKRLKCDIESTHWDIIPYGRCITLANGFKKMVPSLMADVYHQIHRINSSSELSAETIQNISKCLRTFLRPNPMFELTVNNTFMRESTRKRYSQYLLHLDIMLKYADVVNIFPESHQLIHHVEMPI